MTMVTVHGDSIRVEKTCLQEYKYSNESRKLVSKNINTVIEDTHLFLLLLKCYNKLAPVEVNNIYTKTSTL